MCTKPRLRFITCGSVDDGKSTLLGRLLYSAKALTIDQQQALQRDSQRYGTTEHPLDFALILDGLSAEREQGITIDVAYRFFETPKRRFVAVDSPGHEQYTRNMFTGASTCRLALVLIDASRGVLDQSKRHATLLSLVGVKHLIVAVNKMDLVDYQESTFQAIVEEFQNFATKLRIHELHFIPVSALHDVNVTTLSDQTDWYKGPALLSLLETIFVQGEQNLIDFRFPVQLVLRPNPEFRGYAGRLASGSIRPGEDVLLLPSRQLTQIDRIVTADGDLDEAFAGQSVVLTLKDERDLSRGDMIVRPKNLPLVGEKLDALLCWLSETPFQFDKAKALLLKHTTQTVSVSLEKLDYRLDIRSLHRQPAEQLSLNDIARVSLHCSRSLYFDPYERNRNTGSFILIDPDTNHTVAGGVIRNKQELSSPRPKGSIASTNITRVEYQVTPARIEQRSGHKGLIVFLTGLSGAGKSTIAKALSSRLFESGKLVATLDGDNLRHGLCSDLGFSADDRAENIRRVAEVARLIMELGHITICSFIAPYQRDRDFARSLVPDDRFLEVFVHCPIERCIERDPKGLYKKALNGEIVGFTGIDAVYQQPQKPDLILNTDQHDLEACLDQLLQQLEARLTL